MPSITKYRNDDGTGAYCAQVRIKPFQPTSKSFPDKAAARVWARELEKTLREQKKRGGVRPDLATLTLSDLLLEHLKDPEVTKLTTFDDKHRLLSWWIQECGALKVLDLNVLRLREAREKHLKERGPATTNRYMSELRRAWNWGRGAGIIPVNNVWPPELMLTEPKGIVRFLSDDEIKALFDAARAHSPLMFAAIIVSIATGVRMSELLRLNWKDVDLTGKHSPAGPRILLYRTKNDDPRAIHLPESAVTALQALKDEKVRAAHVFIGPDGARLKKSILEYRWNQIRETAKLVDFRWHDLRHSCASYLAQHGASLPQIGAVLGHRSPISTARYAHLVQGAALPAHTGLNTKLQR